MTNKERTDVYTKVFSFLIDHNLDANPLSLPEVCKILNATLVPLSGILANSQFTKEDIFSIWGNEDGVTHYRPLDKIPLKIAYNDLKPLGRIRFTLAEEISHILLGHIYDADFNMFEQHFCDEKYQQYDEEARMASGVLLISPRFYYENREILNHDLICERFKISADCAKTRCEIYDKYEKQITSHRLYEQLPYKRKYVVL